jgi:hypothetical protein
LLLFPVGFLLAELHIRAIFYRKLDEFLSIFDTYLLGQSFSDGHENLMYMLNFFVVDIFRKELLIGLHEKVNLFSQIFQILVLGLVFVQFIVLIGGWGVHE